MHPEQGQKVLLCTTCGRKYPHLQENEAKFVRHVRECSAAHQPEIEEEIAASESDYFRSSADPERFAHIRKGGT